MDIFLLEYNGFPKTFTFIYDVLPSYRVGFIFWIFSLLLFTWFLKFQKKYNKELLNIFTLFISSLAFIGTYIYTTNYIDEMFVGLEQPYNLFHNGLFSFSPKVQYLDQCKPYWIFEHLIN